MTVNELRAKYADVFGEPANARHKEWLIRRIAWRMQAIAGGDLSERARQRGAPMTPEEATQRQIEHYRAMTGEQRLKVALDLHEFACNVSREGIRHQFPEATADEVKQHLRRRIELSRQ